MPFEPRKLYYKIGEVCEIVGLEAYVLRYWETEFPLLSPAKNKAGRRIYRPRDIDLLFRIKKLLYEDGYTISGARKQLSRTRQPAAERGQPREKSEASPGEGAGHETAESLSRVRKELENMLTLLDRE